MQQPLQEFLGELFLVEKRLALHFDRNDVQLPPPISLSDVVNGDEVIRSDVLKDLDRKTVLSKVIQSEMLTFCLSRERVALSVTGRTENY